MVDKPPIGEKELLPLTGHSLSGFRLNPGPSKCHVIILPGDFFQEKPSPLIETKMRNVVWNSGHTL